MRTINHKGVTIYVLHPAKVAVYDGYRYRFFLLHCRSQGVHKMSFAALNHATDGMAFLFLLVVFVGATWIYISK